MLTKDTQSDVCERARERESEFTHILTDFYGWHLCVNTNSLTLNFRYLLLHAYSSSICCRDQKIKIAQHLFNACTFFEKTYLGLNLVREVVVLRVVLAYFAILEILHRHSLDLHRKAMNSVVSVK
mgnify:CR=1 FL=1